MERLRYLLFIVIFCIVAADDYEIFEDDEPEPNPEAHADFQADPGDLFGSPAAMFGGPRM